MCKFVWCRRLWAVAVVLAFCFCACSPSMTSAATKDPAAIGKLLAVFGTMSKADIKNFRLGVVGQLDTDIIDGKLDAEADIYIKDKDNVAIKGLSKITVGKGAEAEVTDRPFYLIADKENLTVYYQEEGKWFKRIDSLVDKSKPRKEDKADKDKAEPNKGESAAGEALDPAKLLKGVEIGQGAAGTETYVVTLDGKIISDAAQSAMKKAPVGREKADAIGADTLAALNNMKDLVFVITVDSRSNMVQEISTDLSDPLVVAATAFVNSMDGLEPAAKEAILPLVKTAKLNLAVKGSHYNQIAPVTVPADIVRKAKVAPKDDGKKLQVSVETEAE